MANLTVEQATRILEQEEQRRIKKNEALRKWRQEHRQQYNEYIKQWRAKQKQQVEEAKALLGK